MRQAKLERMTDEQLVNLFMSTALKQDLAILDDDVSKINCLFDVLVAIREELKARDGDHRDALLRLYDHPNAQVQIKAVKATLVVAPKRARLKLREIADSMEFPQAAEARMTIRNLEEGIFKPT